MPTVSNIAATSAGSGAMAGPIGVEGTLQTDATSAAGREALLGLVQFGSCAVATMAIVVLNYGLNF